MSLNHLLYGGWAVVMWLVVVLSSTKIKDMPHTDILLLGILSGVIALNFKPCREDK